MRRISFLPLGGFVLFLLSASFVSCATNSELTDALATASDAVKDYNTELSSVLNAGSKLSKAAEDITPENEYYIGRSVAATILQSYKVYENPKQEKYVNQIAQALVVNSQMPELYNGYHVKLLDSEEMNAFATSGGHIFITKGMLQCAQSEDALAAVIAHEISHIQLKHSSSAIKTSRYTDFATSAVETALTLNEKEELSDIMNESVSGVVNQLVSNGYSKEQEFQADEYAIGLMVDAGYNPREILSLLDVMKKNADATGNKKTGLLKTHPEPSARIEKAYLLLLKVSNPVETSAKRQARFDKIMK